MVAEETKGVVTRRILNAARDHAWADQDARIIVGMSDGHVFDTEDTEDNRTKVAARGGEVLAVVHWDGSVDRIK